MRTLLRAVRKDRHRQQHERRRVQDDEQDLRIARAFRRRVQRLQLAHRTQSHRRGGVVHAEQIGGEVQRDHADRRMAARHARHQSREQRTECARQQIDQSRAFGDAEKSQPQRQRAEQDDHHVDGQFGHVEKTDDHRREDIGMSADQPLAERGNRGDDEESEPEPIQHVRTETRCARSCNQSPNGSSR